MEALLGALEAWWMAEYLRTARWGYAAVNAVHILGIALLVGAIVPLDLRLLGAWPSVPREALVRVLVPVAAAGLAIAIATGVTLFSVRAREYAGLSVFLAKIGLVAVGTLSALLAHARHGFLLADATRGQSIAHASVSLACWIGALACGRLIAFAE